MACLQKGLCPPAMMPLKTLLCIVLDVLYCARSFEALGPRQGAQVRLMRVLESMAMNHACAMRPISRLCQGKFQISAKSSRQEFPSLHLGNGFSLASGDFDGATFHSCLRFGLKRCLMYSNVLFKLLYNVVLKALHRKFGKDPQFWP